MEYLSGLFFAVDERLLEGKSVDEKVLTILDPKGNLIKSSPLDKQWPMLALSTRYPRYPGPVDGKLSNETLLAWRDAAKMYMEELYKLTIGISYDRFWCHAVNKTDTLLLFLRSFLTAGNRSYDLTEMEPPDEEIHSRIAGLVFLCVASLMCNRRSATEHISPKGHAAFVQKFVKLPFLLDICGLYQHEGMRQEMLVHIVSSSFGAHRRLYTDLKIFVRDLGDLIFQSLEDKFSENDPDIERFPGEEISNKDLTTAIATVCDICCTLQRFVAVAPKDVIAILLDAKLSSRLTKFADQVVWNLNRTVSIRLTEESYSMPRLEMESLLKAKDHGMLMEFAVIDIFRRLECPALLSVESSAKELATCFSTLLNTLPHYQNFAILYEKWTPIRRDIDKAKLKGASVEESLVDFLVHAIKVAFSSQKLPWEKTTGSESNVLDPKNNAVQPKNDVPSPLKDDQSVNIDAEVDEILEVLGSMDLDRVFVKACLLHYDGNVDTTVDSILSGNVPLSISESTAIKELTPPIIALPEPIEVQYVPIPSNIIHNRTDVANPGAFIEKVYYGKRDAYEEIEDGEIPDETKAVTIARVQQMYDDEYDDTYDDFAEAGTMRLNERKDEVTNDLRKMTKDKESSEDDSDADVPSNSASHQHGNAAAVRGNFQSRRGNFSGSASSTRGHQRGSLRGNTSQVNDEVKRREQAKSDPQAESSDVNQGPRDVWTAQMTENHEAQLKRWGPGAAALRGHSGNEARARGNKEKNKANVGNHNRKDRGSWKRSQGMF